MLYYKKTFFLAPNLALAKRCHQPKYEAGDISEQLHSPVWLEMSPLLRHDDTSNRATNCCNSLLLRDRLPLTQGFDHPFEIFPVQIVRRLLQRDLGMFQRFL